MGRIVKQVPHSIIVGFTIGIAVSIAVTQGTEVLGVQATAEGHGAWPKLQAMLEHFGHLNLWAVVLAVGSVLFIKLLLRVSVFIPAPLLAIAAAIGLSQTWLADANLDLVVTKYGAISAKSLQFAAPSLESLDISMFGDIAYYAIAIVFVAAIESLLCAHLADRLAGNRGTPFNADKELWGQGHLMVLVPLLNGFPSTGAWRAPRPTSSWGPFPPCPACSISYSSCYWPITWPTTWNWCPWPASPASCCTLP